MSMYCSLQFFPFTYFQIALTKADWWKCIRHTQLYSSASTFRQLRTISAKIPSCPHRQK